MMNVFTSTQSNPVFRNLILLVVRVFVGFSMITHGYPKLEQLVSGKEIKFFDFLGLGTEISLGLTVFAEFVCSMFIILGLFTRGATIFLIITMAVAAFMVHGADPFSDREMSLLYLSIYLMLLAVGPGKFSVDSLISHKKSKLGY